MKLLREVPIEEITIPKGRREPPKARVESLARSLREVGLLNPITLTEDKRLVAGRTRILAAQSLGWKVIPAQTVKLDDLHAELAEIVENVERSNLPALEEAKALSRMKEIYLALHPQTKHGGDHGKENVDELDQNDKMSFCHPGGDDVSSEEPFTEDAATKTGKSRRTVERAVAVGDAIVPMAAEILDKTAVADNQAALSVVAKLDGIQQIEAAKLIKKRWVKSKADVQKIVAEVAGNGKPPTKSPKQKPATDANKAKHQIKIWADTLGRWLRNDPSIDQYRNKWPGKQGDRVVKLATDLYEALKVWQGSIK